MPFFVYILQSETTDRFYCGQTDDLTTRLERHNGKQVKSTKHSAPWKLIHEQQFASRSEAMKMEQTIKKRGFVGGCPTSAKGRNSARVWGVPQRRDWLESSPPG